MNNPFTIVRKAIRLALPGCAKLEYHYQPREITATPVAAVGNRLEYPRISIVVPSFNQGHFLGHTLNSILSQNYPNLELIVVDGGSSDDSREVIEGYSEHIKWWVSEADSGQANAINKGMAHATGEILAWLNSDDCLMPDALFRVAEKFMVAKNTDVIYGHRVLINEDGQDVGKWVLPGHRKFILTYADYIPQETMYWRAELWHKVGGCVDETFCFAMDWELIRRFIDTGAKFTLLPVFLGQFRMHDMQKTKANIEIDGAREMEVIRQRCRQNFSSNHTLQKLYFYWQRQSYKAFLLRARLTELLWLKKLIRID